MRADVLRNIPVATGVSYRSEDIPILLKLPIVVASSVPAIVPVDKLFVLIFAARTAKG